MEVEREEEMRMEGKGEERRRNTVRGRERRGGIVALEVVDLPTYKEKTEAKRNSEEQIVKRSRQPSKLAYN